MARNHGRNGHAKTSDEASSVVIDDSEATVASLIASAENSLSRISPADFIAVFGSSPSIDREVKPHLRCPCCWGKYRGRAKKMKWWRQVCGPVVNRCYLCDQCGTEWVVEVKNDVVDDIEYKTTKVIEVRTNDPTKEASHA